VSSSGFTGYHAEAKVSGPGVVTGRYGTLGDVYFVKQDFWPLNTTLFVSDFKGNNPRFTSYLLKYLQLDRYSGAAAVPGIDRNVIHRIQVRVPPPTVQLKIVSILSALDDLIENNLRRIELLETTGETIFVEWFVNFRFPGHDEAHFSDTAAGTVPGTWTFDRLDQLAEIRKGRQPKELVDERVNGQLPYILIDVLIGGAPRYASLEGAVVCAEEDVLMVMDGASSGLVFTGYSGVVGSTLAAISPIGPIAGCNNYLFFLLHSKFEEIRGKNVGAAIPHANKDYLQQMAVIVPNREILDEFEHIAVETSKLAVALKKRNQFLRQSRDLLLPKLLSGEVNVGDLDIKVEEQNT
jgi:type I restriction enzyme S subunit